jgi:hypothetical protein
MFGFGEVVHRHNVKSAWALEHGSKDKAADASEAVDSHLYRHEKSPQVTPAGSQARRLGSNSRSIALIVTYSVWQPLPPVEWPGIRNQNTQRGFPWRQRFEWL